MSYIKSTLISGEEIISEAKMSRWFFASEIFIGVLLVSLGLLSQIALLASTIVKDYFSSIFNYAFIIFGIIILMRAYIIYISTELAFTNKRVIAKVGFIKRDTVEMNITKVETIQVHQSLLGRILNYGTVIISGAGTPQAPIKGIAKPIQFRTKFMEFTSHHE